MHEREAFTETETLFHNWNCFDKVRKSAYIQNDILLYKRHTQWKNEIFHTNIVAVLWVLQAFQAIKSQMPLKDFLKLYHKQQHIK